MAAYARAVRWVLVPLLVLPGVQAVASAPAGAQASAGIEGTVTGEDGSALRDVCVEAYPTDDSAPPTSARTDAAGNYRLDVAAGEYLVGFNTCTEPLTGFAAEWYDNVPSPEAATPVAVSGTGSRRGIDAALAPTGTISGRVTDQDSGTALVDVCVVALGDQTSDVVQDQTGQDGRYRLENLPAGDYIVIFGDCSRPYTHITEFYDDLQVDDAQTGQEPTPVPVTSGQDTGGVDAALEEGGAIEGVVTALHTGRQQPLVCVGLFPADNPEQDGGEPAGGAVTGFNSAPDVAVPPGQYDVAGVRPGRYVLAFNPAMCSDDGYAVTWYDAQATRAEATVLTVRKGQVNASVDGVVIPLPSISFACPPGGGGEGGFPDVPPDSVHRAALECMATYGVVMGRSDGSYGPDEPVRRAQLASFLARLLEVAGVALPDNPPDAFDDDRGDVHERAINQLAELGVVSGKGGRRYAPQDTVERGQLATVLVAAYEEATGFPLRAPQDRFGDDEGTTHETSINKAATAGLTAGARETRYAPAGLVRRDQMASFLARTFDRVQRDTVSVFEQEGAETFSAAAGEPAAAARQLTVTLEGLARDAARSLRHQPGWQAGQQ
jgi:hypothetical protein